MLPPESQRKWLRLGNVGGHTPSVDLSRVARAARYLLAKLQGPAVVLLLAVGIAASLPSAASAAPVLSAPAAGASMWSDESMLFEWDGPWSDFGDQLSLTSPGGVSSDFQTFAAAKNFAAGYFVPGSWSWQVCTLAGPGIAGACSERRTLNVKSSPKINQAIAATQLRQKIRKLWRGSRGITARCSRQSNLSYRCRPTWRTRRSRYAGVASVSLYDHKYGVDIYVTSRSGR